MRNVEVEVIFKNFLWTIIFIAMTAFLSNSYIIPSINYLKQQQFRNQNSENILVQTKAIYNASKIELDSILDENKVKLTILYGGIEVSDIESGINNNFLELAITKKSIKEDKENELELTHFEIVGKSPNLYNILDIPDALERKNMVASLELPLKISKDKNGNLDFTLNIVTTVSVYNHAKFRQELRESYENK